VGSRAGLDAMEKRKIVPFQELNPSHPARSLSLYRLIYPIPKEIMYRRDFDEK
jgi:hypothetical protein